MSAPSPLNGVRGETAWRFSRRDAPINPVQAANKGSNSFGPFVPEQRIPLSGRAAIAASQDQQAVGSPRRASPGQAPRPTRMEPVARSWRRRMLPEYRPDQTQ